MANSTPVSYVIFSALYAPHAGGVEAYTAGIAGELVRRGNRVTVVTSRLSKASPTHETQKNGVEVVRLPCRALMDGRLPLLRRDAAFHREMEALAAREFDRAIVNTRFYGLSLEGARFAVKEKIPTVVVEHGSAHLSLGRAVLDRAVQTYEHRATKRIQACNLPFCAVSQAAGAWLGHFGITCEGIVPNALDARAYMDDASNRDFRQELGISQDTLLVAFVGRLVPEKGARELLDAMRILAEAHGSANEAPLGEGRATGKEARFACPDSPAANNLEPGEHKPEREPEHEPERNIALVFAGTGPLLSDIRQAARTLPVFALGRLDASDVAALLRASDALCLPSRSEGFATVLLEAAAAECMPIATDVGGARELGISENGRETTGILLPSMQAEDIAQALDQAERNRALCRDRAARIEQEVRANHGWPQTADAFEQLFARIEQDSPFSKGSLT